jgi:CheY-like chemotaxis protein
MGESLRLEVWDTGIGVPESKQREIFDEFLRLDQGARAARGLGLGLSIVQRLGKVLGHPITVRSKHGAGSVFSIAARIGAPVAPVVEMSGAPEAPRSGEPLSGLHVIAIDNEPRVLEGMQILMQKWGCRVTTAASCEAALSVLKDPPDVIIADYHLDDGDGLAAIQHVRDKFGAHIPAVLATAERSLDVRAAAEGDDVAVLYKPVKPAPLRAQLSRCLALRAAAE